MRDCAELLGIARRWRQSTRNEQLLALCEAVEELLRAPVGAQVTEIVAEKAIIGKRRVGRPRSGEACYAHISED